jgi:hypothetical protein
VVVSEAAVVVVVPLPFLVKPKSYVISKPLMVTPDPMIATPPSRPLESNVMSPPAPLIVALYPSSGPPTANWLLSIESVKAFPESRQTNA